MNNREFTLKDARRWVVKYKPDVRENGYKISLAFCKVSNVYRMAAAKLSPKDHEKLKKREQAADEIGALDYLISHFGPDFPNNSSGRPSTEGEVEQQDQPQTESVESQDSGDGNDQRSSDMGQSRKGTSGSPPQVSSSQSKDDKPNGKGDAARSSDSADTGTQKSSGGNSISQRRTTDSGQAAGPGSKESGKKVPFQSGRNTGTAQRDTSGGEFSELFAKAQQSSELTYDEQVNEVIGPAQAKYAGSTGGSTAARGQWAGRFGPQDPKRDPPSSQLSKKLLRQINQMVDQVVSSLGETSPRFDAAKVVKELVSKRYRLDLARRVERKPPVVIFLADVSPSCGRWAPDTEAVIETLAAHNDNVLAIKHSNGYIQDGYSNEVGMMGKLAQYVDLSSLPDHSPATVTYALQQFLPSMDVAMVVALGDWDASELYKAWAKKVPVIWLNGDDGGGGYGREVADIAYYAEGISKLPQMVDEFQKLLQKGQSFCGQSAKPTHIQDIVPY